MALVLRLRLAASFLTILPVFPLGVATSRDLAASMGWYPVVGLGVGGLLAVAWVGGQGWLPPGPLLILLLGLELVLTGGLHADGLADAADGLGASGRTPEERLHIMRDPRVGPMGVAAVWLWLTFRFTALLLLLPHFGPPLWGAFAVVPRVAFPIVAKIFPYARGDGKGSFVQALTVPDVLLAAALGIGAMAVLMGTLGLWALGGGILGSLLVGVLAHRAIGGITGDVLGAAGCAAEVGYLTLLLGLSAGAGA